jgi:hypothetical protein
MRYHVTIERQLHRALDELERLQERRRAAEAEPAPSSSGHAPLRLLPRDRETLQNTDALKGEETWDDLIDEMARELEAYCVQARGGDPASFHDVLPNEPNDDSSAGPL